MIILMGVSLYTSRLILNILGVEDFGIYNVVGGVVTMFSFINSSMSSAIQRFISFELGMKNFEKLRDLFSMSVNIHLLIALIIFILAETIGLWFLNTYLVIPSDRIEAANWVYQFSILSFMVTIMNVPYNAFIVAHERMNVFAFVGIIEVILKLVIVFSLTWFGIDKLKFYGILIFSVSAIIWMVYRLYCFKYFKETKYRFFWDKTLFKTLMNYSGWNLFGSIAAVAMGQGINILLNIFFNPVVNAARAISYQVNGAVNGFVTNFQVAINPQIIKSYAENEIMYMHQLIIKGSKYSFFLLLLFTLPLLLETEFFLKLWLNNVPINTLAFCRLVLICSLIDSMSGPLMTAAHATGKIKFYQGVVGSLMLLILPFSFLLFKLGFSPVSTLYVNIFFSIISIFVRLKIISPLIRFSVTLFIKRVLLVILFVTSISLIVPLSIFFLLPDGLFRLVLVIIFSIFSIVITIFYLGLENQERNFIIDKIKNKFCNNLIKYE
jgi:O-antigen/teichoic acid export membrane protein